MSNNNNPSIISSWTGANSWTNSSNPSSWNGWIIGRRATCTQREFFVLLDDKFTTLQDAQEEVDRLARTYFYNIFIH